MKTLRRACACIAFVVYAFRGSPTPDDPALPELLIGLCLMVAVGIGGLWQALSFVRTPGAPHPRHGTAFRAGQILLIYGLSVPLIGGAMMGHGAESILRDVLPFLFLLLPVFLLDLFDSAQGRVRTLAGFAVLIGIFFALRSIVPLLTHHDLPLFSSGAPSDLLYLANAPTVLFAAVILLGGAAYILAGLLAQDLPLWRRLLLAAALTALACLPVLAMASVIQRAGIGYVLCAAAAIVLHILILAPRRLFWPVLGCLLCAGFLWPLAHTWLEIALHKTSLVGMNMRLQEATAVLDTISAHPLSFLFGQGWGAGFHSPAVGGLYVTFTHNLLTSFWLKTGLVGMILIAFYVGAIALRLAQWTIQSHKQPEHILCALALAGPIAINTFLYASHKSLDFGIILLVAMACCSLNKRSNAESGAAPISTP